MCYRGWNLNMVIGRCWVGMQGHSSREWWIIRKWTWIWKLCHLWVVPWINYDTSGSLVHNGRWGVGGGGWGLRCLGQFFRLPIFYPSFNILISNMKWWEGHWEKKNYNKEAKKERWKGERKARRKDYTFAIQILHSNPGSAADHLQYWDKMFFLLFQTLCFSFRRTWLLPKMVTYRTDRENMYTKSLEHGLHKMSVKSLWKPTWNEPAEWSFPRHRWSSAHTHTWHHHNTDHVLLFFFQVLVSY